MVDGIVNSFLQALKGDFMLQVIRNTLSYKYAFWAGLLLLIFLLFISICIILINLDFSQNLMFSSFLPLSLFINGLIITAASSGIWFLIITIDIIKHKSHKPLETKSKTTLVKDFVVIIYALYSLFVAFVLYKIYS